MSATEELRRMLDERGVEYFRHEDDEPLRKLEKADEPATSWRIGGASVCAVPIEGGELFDPWIDHCTPEQAIAATLGRGECEDEGGIGANGEQAFSCSKCGCVLSLYDSDGANTLCTGFVHDYPRFCPACGRRVKR